MNPTVSVLMPVYNCQPYIEKAIASILNQTYGNIELVVCDDGSTDLTWNVINTFSDSRIKKFRNEKNSGYLQTYNFLMTQVKTDYFTFQDADDWSDEARIQKQLDVFEKIKDIQLCACNGTFYYTGAIQKPCPPFKSGYISLTEGNFEFMLPSVMYKKEVLNKIGAFHPFFDRTTGGDQYFILEVLSNFRGYAINEYLYVARFNPTSNHRTLSSLKKLAAPDLYFLLKKQRVSTGTDWLLEKKENLLLDYERKLLKDRKFMAEKYREYAVYKIDSDLIRPGLKLIFASFSYWPFWLPTYRTLYYAFRRMLIRR